MPKFNVHVYAVVRVQVDGVDADNSTAAAAEALERLDLYRRVDRHSGLQLAEEYAEDIEGYLVDPIGDDGGVLVDESRYYLDRAHLAAIEFARAEHAELFDEN